MPFTLDASAEAWPTPEEFAKCKEIRELCKEQIATLKDPAEDVVGDIRICRFLRSRNGKVDLAADWFRSFLEMRVSTSTIEELRGSTIDEVRKCVIGLDIDEFHAYLEEFRSPFAVPFAILGESAGGHLIAYGAPGEFNTKAFMERRPTCHPFDTDLLIVVTALEWFLWQLDQRSRKLKKMVQLIKVINLAHFGKYRPAPFVPEIRSSISRYGSSILKWYCEQDILTVFVNAPFIFRAVYAIISAIMSARQQARVRSFKSAQDKACREIFDSLGEQELLPTAVGGSRTSIPFVTPNPADDEHFVRAFLSRTTSLTTAIASRPRKAAQPNSGLVPTVTSAATNMASKTTGNLNKTAPQAPASATALPTTNELDDVVGNSPRKCAAKATSYVGEGPVSSHSVILQDTVIEDESATQGRSLWCCSSS